MIPNFDPISKNHFRAHIQHNFASAYLTLVSIVQGVSFGILVSNLSQRFMSGSPSVPTTFLIYPALGFSTLILTFYCYSYFVSVIYVLPNLRESVIPFCLAAAQVAPSFFFHQRKYWWLCFSIYCFLAAIAFHNTSRSIYKHSYSDDFEEAYPITKFEALSNSLIALLAGFVATAATLAYPHSSVAPAMLTKFDVVPLLVICFCMTVMVCKSQLWYLPKMYRESGLIRAIADPAPAPLPSGGLEKMNADPTSVSTITRERMAERAQAYGRDQYLFVYSVLKGAVLANAAYVLSVFLSSSPKNMALFPLWLASFGALILTYNTTFRGTLFLNHRVTWLDTVFPLVLALTEFLLFSVLQTPSSLTRTPTIWYLVFGMHNGVACIIVWNRRRQVRFSDYSFDLHPLLIRYSSWLKRDMIGAGASSACWLTVWGALTFYLIPRFRWTAEFHPYLGMAAFAVTAMVIVSAETDRREALRTILNPTRKESP